MKEFSKINLFQYLIVNIEISLSPFLNRLVFSKTKLVIFDLSLNNAKAKYILLLTNTGT